MYMYSREAEHRVYKMLLIGLAPVARLTHTQHELAAGNVDGPLDVNDNHKALTITSKKVTSSHESWGGPRGIGPTAPIFWGDASHGSHRVVAPMNPTPKLQSLLSQERVKLRTSDFVYAHS